MKTKSRRRAFKIQVTQKTSIKRTLVVCTMAFMVAGGFFIYLNFGNNSESKAEVMDVNKVEDSEPLTQFSVDQPFHSRSAMNYSVNDKNQINVREMR